MTFMRITRYFMSQYFLDHSILNILSLNEVAVTEIFYVGDGPCPRHRIIMLHMLVQTSTYVYMHALNTTAHQITTGAHLNEGSAYFN